MRTSSCFHIYSTFDCHFWQNQKSRSDMADPVFSMTYNQVMLQDIKKSFDDVHWNVNA